MKITDEWLDQNPDYTCGCGLYVHPSKRNPRAIHITGCQFDTAAEREACIGECERLRARVSELERDAARYRWLRQERYMFREGAVVTCDEQAETVALWVKCPVTNCICEVDAAIDADMKEQP